MQEYYPITIPADLDLAAAAARLREALANPPPGFNGIMANLGADERRARRVHNLVGRTMHGLRDAVPENINGNFVVLLPSPPVTVGIATGQPLSSKEVRHILAARRKLYKEWRPSPTPPATPEPERKLGFAEQNLVHQVLDIITEHRRPAGSPTFAFSANNLDAAAAQAHLRREYGLVTAITNDPIPTLLVADPAAAEAELIHHAHYGSCLSVVSPFNFSDEIEAARRTLLDDPGEMPRAALRDEPGRFFDRRPWRRHAASSDRRHTYAPRDRDNGLTRETPESDRGDE